MSRYEIRAEHHPGELDRNGNRWHVVRQRSLLGLCGRMLSPVSELRPIAEFERLESQRRCPLCSGIRQELAARPAA